MSEAVEEGQTVARVSYAGDVELDVEGHPHLGVSPLVFLRHIRPSPLLPLLSMPPACGPYGFSLCLLGEILSFSLRLCAIVLLAIASSYGVSSTTTPASRTRPSARNLHVN